MAPDTNTPTQPTSPPELIVITRPDAGVRIEDDHVASATGASMSDLDGILQAEGARLEPLFDGGDDDGAEPMMAQAAPADAPEGVGGFFHVQAPEDRLEAIAEQLRGLDTVEAAYVKPPAEPAQVLVEGTDTLIVLEPASASPPAATPDFTSRQGYLGAAPAGIEAAYAWGLPGGRGTGIKVIDCEWGWQLTHEDLAQASMGLVAGANHSSTDHGTAVFGEIGGDRNATGVTGMADAAQLGASSFTNQASATAIKKAADALSAGDIILLEIHRAGPNATGSGQKGYVAVEWWPDDLLAIRYAVNKGIIVVEAAGNGWEDLDAAVYDTPSPGFPSWWRNPFELSNPGSGAVVVGAGSPPSGTHGRTTSPWNLPYVDRARCGFSNWGSRIDAQGWGWEVTTTGYGDLQGGSDRDRWYTDRFSGTSSASPIVTGALACVQGILKAKNMPLMTSERARQLLRSTGSPQQDAPGRPVSQRIGNRPNLRQLVPAALRQWIYNTTIDYTYALSSSQAAWAHVQGLGWRRIATGSPDGVANVFRAACEAQAAGTTVHVYVDDADLYNLWVP